MRPRVAARHADQGVEQRRLAGAVAAKQGERLAGLEREVDALDDDRLAVAGAQAADAHQLAHGATPMDRLILAEIDRLDARIAGHGRDVALGEDGAVDQHGDGLREVEDQVHVVLDEQDRDVGRQRADGLEDLLALAFGHARDRLVEQQHARLAGERERDLEQAALAVGERVDRPVHHVDEAEPIEQGLAFGGDGRIAAERAPPPRAGAALHRDRERQRRERRQRVEQLVDLEGADDAAPDAPMGGQRRDVGAVEDDPSGGWQEHAGEQVDERRLAGAVRADQRVARAALDGQRDVVAGRGQAAEALDQRAGLEDGRHVIVTDAGRARSRAARSARGRPAPARRGRGRARNSSIAVSTPRSRHAGP